MDLTIGQLQDLFFTAEAFAGSPDSTQQAAGRRALLQLQCLLSTRASHSPALQQQTAGLLQQCTKQLHKLRVEASTSEARKASLGRVLAKAGCPAGFQFSNPRGFSMLEDLKKIGPFKHILQAGPSSQGTRQHPAKAVAAGMLRALGERNAGASANRLGACVQLGKPPQLPLQQPVPQPQLQPVPYPPAQPEQAPGPRRSGFQVPPPSRSGGLPTATSALRNAQQQVQQGRQPQATCRPSQQQQQQQAGGHGPIHVSTHDPGASGAAAGQPWYAQAPQEQQPQPSSRAQHGGQESKWGPAKMPRRAQDAHVHHARQHQQHWGGIEEQEEEGELAGMEEGSAADQGAGANPFQSAKAKLIHDMRKSGQQPYFGQQQGAPGGGGIGPPARQGLLRPNGGGKALGGRRPLPAGVQGGVNKGFIPPFVKKALDVQNGGAGSAGGGGQGATGHPGEPEAEGPLSLRTREFLKLGPEEPLPEELAKLDPQLIEQVCNDIVETGKTSWDDIAGQEVAKKLIQEVVVWPLLNPHIFTGARAPPRGILLFGPPGTGKTLLGKAIASNIQATFFSISASSLTSKWIGEGEKMVRTLFAVAGWVAPSVIFIDEIDSLLSARKSEGEHEASRRLKTEMLVQMEGCDPSLADRRVLLIGATNRPEELDEAARRRMPKQLYIPLPDADARRGMVLRQLGPGAPICAALAPADVDKVVQRTAGYSGSDMKNLIQEACQGPVRDAVKQHGSGVAALQAADLRPVVLRDFQLAARAQKASVEPSEIVRYEQYNEKHGAKILAEEEQQGEEEDW